MRLKLTPRKVGAGMKRREGVEQVRLKMGLVNIN